MTFVFWFVILKSNFDFLVTVAAPETPHITYFVHSFQHIHIKCFYLASHHLLQGLHPFYWYVIFLLMSCLLLYTSPCSLCTLNIFISPLSLLCSCSSSPLLCPLQHRGNHMFCMPSGTAPPAKSIKIRAGMGSERGPWERWSRLACDGGFLPRRSRVDHL